VLPALAYYFSITTSFDFWVSKGAYDVFALMINFLSNYWQLIHVIIGLFEATKIIGQTLAINI
jgi:hypothetical protein